MKKTGVERQGNRRAKEKMMEKRKNRLTKLAVGVYGKANSGNKTTD